MKFKILLSICFLFPFLSLKAHTPQPIRQFLSPSYMKGASFSFLAKEVKSGDVLYEYDVNRELTPASVMKTITTATALDLLGEDYRFGTFLEYDGQISGETLNGNLYIRGTGDPTIGSSKLDSDKDSVINLWVAAVRAAGIRKITGSVIADEQLFDTEGVSMKWLREDMGNYYAPGSYALSVFDNQYRLTFKTGEAGSRPAITGCVPDMPSLVFRNYLNAQPVRSDSCIIVGAPYSNERTLYGVMPANRNYITLEGDIPDPALFLAQYLSSKLAAQGIQTTGTATTSRLLSLQDKWYQTDRKALITTYSPDLREICRITNYISHNLYADALIKTLGLSYQPKPNEVVSSFGRGCKVIASHWQAKGLDTRSLWMYDGSGLAATDKLTTSFTCNLYLYMATRSKAAEAFFDSFPKVGEDGSVRNFLKGTALQGKARLKSGSMSRVRGYGGYIQKDGKQYAVSLFVNNFSCTNREMTAAIEKLLISLFQ